MAQQEQVQAKLDAPTSGLISLMYPSNLGDSTRLQKIIFTIYEQNPATYSKNLKQVAQDSALYFGSTFAGDAVSGQLEKTSPTWAEAAGEVAKAVTGAAGAGGLLNLQSTLFNPATSTSKGTIALYMPNTVNQNQKLSWQTMSLTHEFGLTGLAGQVGSSILDNFKNSDSIKDAISTLPESLTPAGIEAGGLLTKKEKVADYALSLTGNAINPQLELMFKGIDFRTFQFEFLFSPRDSSESRSIIEIIKTFRYHSAPSLDSASNGGRYFKIPDFFGIDYIYNGASNNNLPKLSSCILETITVDYSPNGWVTYDDGMPIQIRLVLQFRETQIIHKDLISKGY